MSSYIDASLAPGEQVLHRARFPIVHWVLAWLMLLLLGVFVIGIVIFAIWAVRMRTTEMGVTDHRVILKAGLFRRHTREIAVTTVETVEVHQSVLGRLFGYGRILIKGTGEAELLFPPMQNPLRFRRAIEEGRGETR